MIKYVFIFLLRPIITKNIRKIIKDNFSNEKKKINTINKGNDNDKQDNDKIDNDNDKIDNDNDKIDNDNDKIDDDDKQDNDKIDNDNDKIDNDNDKIDNDNDKIDNDKQDNDNDKIDNDDDKIDNDDDKHDDEKNLLKTKSSNHKSNKKSNKSLSKKKTKKNSPLTKSKNNKFIKNINIFIIECFITYFIIMILYKIFLKKLLNPLENSILTKKQDTSSDLKREKTKEQDEKSFMKLLLLQQMLSNPQKIKIDFDLPEVGTVYDKPKILKDTEKKEYFEKMKNFTIIGSDGINDENRIINDLKNKKQNIVQILNKIKKIFSEFNDLNTIHKNFLENDKNNINNMNFINNKLNELIKNLEQRLEEVDKNLKDLDLQKKNNLYKII